MISEENLALTLKGVTKTYRSPAYVVDALRDVGLTVKQGETLCVMGPSGSGKTTLLKVSGGLLRPDSGQVYLNGTNLYQQNPDEMTRLRRNHTAFMFQENLLIDTLTVKENVELPLIIEGRPKKERKELTLETLRTVGLQDLKDQKPGEVSGGERRRISLARCLAKKADILFIDEPTSNLDSKTSLQIIQHLKKINAQGTTLVLSTHDPLIAKHVGHITYIRDGRLSSNPEELVGGEIHNE
jgi:putative ABC transport system ATP-binding protein